MQVVAKELSRQLVAMDFPLSAYFRASPGPSVCSLFYYFVSLRMLFLFFFIVLFLFLFCYRLSVFRCPPISVQALLSQVPAANFSTTVSRQLLLIDFSLFCFSFIVSLHISVQAWPGAGWYRLCLGWLAWEAVSGLLHLLLHLLLLNLLLLLHLLLLLRILLLLHHHQL